MKRFKQVDHTTEMSFLEHLDELRYRLLVCVIAILATTLLVGFPLSQRFIGILIKPLGRIELRRTDNPLTILVSPDGALRVKDPAAAREIATEGKLSSFRFDFEFEAPEADKPEVFHFGPNPQSDLYYFGLFDPFFLILKAALLLGIATAIPIWLTQLWKFISPAFTPNELRAVRPVFLSAVLLFPAGACFAYFGMSIVLQMMVNSFLIPGLEPRLEVGRYFSLILMFMLVFGAIFETPVVIVLLVRMGVVSTKFLRSTRQYAILLLAVISAILTPADPFSMMMMFIPFYALYEISIWISVALERRLEAESREESSNGERT